MGICVIYHLEWSQQVEEEDNSTQGTQKIVSV